MQYRYAVEFSGLILISITFLVFLALSFLDGAGKLGVNNTDNTNQFNNTQTEPTPLTFSIWGVVDLWQLAWIIYAWTFSFRPNSPKAISSRVYYGSTIAVLFQIAWLFVWGAPLLSAAAVLLISSAFSFYFTIGSEVIYLSKATNIKFCELWFSRILVVNGLAFYATWTTVAALLNVNVALQYDRGLDPVIASYIVLFVLAFFVLIYFILESTVLDKCLRHVFVVYPVLIWSLVGILVGNWKQNDPTGVNLLTFGLLVVTVTLAFVRVVLFILFTITCPLNSSKIVQSDDEPMYPQKV